MEQKKLEHERYLNDSKRADLKTELEMKAEYDRRQLEMIHKHEQTMKRIEMEKQQDQHMHEAYMKLSKKTLNSNPAVKKQSVPFHSGNAVEDEVKVSPVTTKPIVTNPIETLSKSKEDIVTFRSYDLDSLSPKEKQELMDIFVGKQIISKPKNDITSTSPNISEFDYYPFLFTGFYFLIYLIINVKFIKNQFFIIKILYFKN